jgi:hypothetical protein
MKRIIFVLIVSFMLVSLMAYAFRVSAQDKRPFTAGLKAGINLSQLRGNDLSLSSGTAFRFADNSNRATGLVGGVFARFGQTVYLQPEVLLSQKGGRFQLNNAQDLVDVRFTNLDVPVLIGLKVGDVLRINLGPVASVPLRDNGSLRDSFEIYATQENAFRRTTFGYQAGVGFDFDRLNLDLRYEGNFNDAFRVNFANSAQFAGKTNLWQATLGYALF